MSSKIYGTVLLAIITCFAAADALDDDGHLLSVIITGNVFCDTCYKQHFSKNSYFISGASVAVECRNNKQTPDFRIEAKTNDYGQFRVEIPPSIFHSDKQLKRCSAMLLPNEEQKGPCKLVFITNSSSFILKSKQGSSHTYSAGFFSYRPQSPPPFCSQDAANNPESALKAPLQSSEAFGLLPFLQPFFSSPPPPPPPPPPPFLPQFPQIPPQLPFNIPPFPFLTPPPPPPLFSVPALPFYTPPPPPPPPLFSLPPPPFFTPPSLFLPLPANPFQPPPLISNPFQPPPQIPNSFYPPPQIINTFQPPPLIPNSFYPPPPIINTFQPPPLIPNPFQPPPLIPDPSLIPIPFETPPLVPLPPLPPIDPPPLVPLPPLPPIPLPPTKPPPLIPPARHSLPIHN